MQRVPSSTAKEQHICCVCAPVRALDPRPSIMLTGQKAAAPIRTWAPGIDLLCAFTVWLAMKTCLNCRTSAHLEGAHQRFLTMLQPPNEHCWAANRSLLTGGCPAAPRCMAAMQLQHSKLSSTSTTGFGYFADAANSQLANCWLQRASSSSAATVLSCSSEEGLLWRQSFLRNWGQIGVGCSPHSRVFERWIRKGNID